MPAPASRKSLPKPASADGNDVGAIRLGYLAHSIAFHLRLAQNASFREFDRLVGEKNLKPGHFAMLTLIGENPGISQSALSLASGRDTSSLTAILDNFVRRKLVSRQRVPHN